MPKDNLSASERLAELGYTHFRDALLYLTMTEQKLATARADMSVLQAQIRALKTDMESAATAEFERVEAEDAHQYRLLQTERLIRSVGLEPDCES